MSWRHIRYFLRGIQDENALESADIDFNALSADEHNIKLAFIGRRCPTLAPTETSSPDIIEKCPVIGTGVDKQYNMANKFIFEPDDESQNPTGMTTGFATNPFTAQKSSVLAGLLNLEEMTTQLQSLPPDKNIIKLIRIRQILEALQVLPVPEIAIPGKKDSFLNPQPLRGVDLIQVDLPRNEKIEDWLNDTTTKNHSIQTLIEVYGYTNAKEAYPQISAEL